MRSVLAVAAWTLLGLLPAPPALAERHALLIGVNQVAALPQRLRLRGAVNDVVLMRQVLLAKGFAEGRITVLARGAPGATGSPTHAAVAAAMQGLLAKAHPGETVVLHLAGHGAQVPQRDDAGVAEPDGLDEVFLLEDTARWDPAAGRLPHALYDDTIGQWIDALVDRGAKVLAIFDACHAGGMARNAGTYAVWRSVAGAELGVPSVASAGAIPRTTTPPTKAAAMAQPRLDGRVLAFAARGHELAGEEWLPRGDRGSSARVHGVFSFEVATAIRDGVGEAAALRQRLKDRYHQTGRVQPTPVVTGDVRWGE